MPRFPVLSSATPSGMKPGGTDATWPVVIEKDCEQAVTWMARGLTAAGMRVARSDFLRSRHRLGRADLGGLRAVPSFDLYALFSQPCPHHRNEACTCRTAVMSVQDPSGTWVALVARGYEGRTWVSLVDVAARPPPGGLASTICQAIAGLST